MILFSVLASFVNPLWVTPTPWTDHGFDDYKPIHKHPRTGKAGLIRSFDWDAVLLGSSRVDIAFDPTHPAFGDLRVANLALRGGTLAEHLAMLKFSSKHEDVQMAILGLDLTDMTWPIDIPPGAGFNESLLGETGSTFEKDLRYLSGYSTFAMSVKAVNYRSRGRLAAYTAEGHWIRNLDRRPLRTVLQYESFMWANRYIAARKQSIDINPNKVEALRGIIRHCYEKDIRLIICFPPNHAAFLSVFQLKDDPDPGFRTERELITRVIREEAEAAEKDEVPLWDFIDFHPYNCEALPPIEEPRRHLEMWADGTHALPSLGSIMLSRMLDHPLEDPEAADYGVWLVHDEVDARVTSIREGHERYRRDQPEDVAWVREHMDLWERDR